MSRGCSLLSRRRGVALILITAASALLVACSTREPDLHLDQDQIDLGQVVNGEVVDFEVGLLNRGDADLVIEAVSTSCGCTSAQVVPTTLKPGESGALQVTFDSGAHGPQELGHVVRQIFIASNDPDQSELEFRLSADILPPDP